MVQSLADVGVFPSDARAIHGSLASSDKTLAFVKGAHYFEDSDINLVAVADLVADWIRARL